MSGQTRLIMMAALAMSVVGVILVLTEPFGGMTVRVPVAGFYERAEFRERYASLGSDYSEPLDNLFMALLAVSMLLMAFVSIRALVSGETGFRKQATTALVVAIATILLAAAGGISFDLVRSDSRYGDWWLDTGFYAALVVGLVNSAAYLYILRRRESASTTHRSGTP